MKTLIFALAIVVMALAAQPAAAAKIPTKEAATAHCHVEVQNNMQVVIRNSALGGMTEQQIVDDFLAYAESSGLSGAAKTTFVALIRAMHGDDKAGLMRAYEKVVATCVGDLRELQA